MKIEIGHLIRRAFRNGPFKLHFPLVFKYNRSMKNVLESEREKIKRQKQKCEERLKFQRLSAVFGYQVL